MHSLFAALLWLATLLPAPGVWAHEVREQVRQTTATLIQLTYADDEPFSFERYELFAEGRERPVYTGRTDAGGRIVFLPDDVLRWRLRSFSEDGHGVDFSFEVQAVPVTATGAAPGMDRPLRVALGLAAIAVVFGLLHWLVRRRARTSQPG